MRLPQMLLTSFGLGHLKPAPGTWGSTPPPAVALVLVAILSFGGLTGTDLWIINAALVLLLLVFSYACAAFGDWAEAWYGKKDPGQVVADEVAGQSVALLFLPWRAMTEWNVFWYDIALAATAFFAFRLFDIIKPPPAHQVQRWPSGWGILVDDLFAGVYALIVTQLLARMIWLPMLESGG